MDFESAKKFLGFLKKPISSAQLKEFDGLLNEVLIDKLKHVHKPLIRCVKNNKTIGEVLQISLNDKGLIGGMADFGKKEAETFFGDEYLLEMSLDGKTWFKFNFKSIKL